jgi:cell surface protein SprA
VGAPNLLSRNTEDAINPSLTLNFKFDVGMSVGVSYSKKREETFGFNSTVSDWETKSGNVSIDYSFRKPRGLRLPLIGIVLNLKSEVSTTLNISLSEQKQFRSGIVETDKQDFKVGFSTSYSFSRNVTGRLTFDYGTQHNRKVERTRNTIALMFNVAFKF